MGSSRNRHEKKIKIDKNWDVGTSQNQVISSYLGLLSENKSFSLREEICMSNSIYFVLSSILQTTFTLSDICHFTIHEFLQHAAADLSRPSLLVTSNSLEFLFKSFSPQGSSDSLSSKLPL